MWCIRGNGWCLGGSYLSASSFCRVLLCWVPQHWPAGPSSPGPHCSLYPPPVHWTSYFPWMWPRWRGCSLSWWPPSCQHCWPLSPQGCWALAFSWRRSWFWPTLDETQKGTLSFCWKMTKYSKISKQQQQKNISKTEFSQQKLFSIISSIENIK